MISKNHGTFQAQTKYLYISQFFYDYLLQINRIWKKYSWICSLKYNRHSKLIFQWEFWSVFLKSSGRILKPSWRSFVAESLQVFQLKKSVSSSILSNFFKNLIGILIWKAAFFVQLIVEISRDFYFGGPKKFITYLCEYLLLYPPVHLSWLKVKSTRSIMQF